MKQKQIGDRARDNRIRLAVIVAEFHQDGIVLKKLNNRTDLTAQNAVRGQVRQQRYHIED
jgi:hypothetical protein